MRGANSNIWAAIAAMALLTACSRPPTTTGALLVVVSVEAQAAAQCVRVVAAPDRGTPAATEPMARKDELRVAVFKGEDWSGKVAIVARGYGQCDDAVAAFLEESDAVVSQTYEGEVRVTLKGKPAADGDGDGRSGSDDCDDNDPSRYAGATESCASAVDNNCSGAIGCADSACQGACLPSGAGSCQSGVCAAPEQLACTDGADNDNDGLADCRDPDCFASTCDDRNACTAGDVCRGDGGCAGNPAAVVCNSPPTGTCLSGPGACNPLDAGCMYPARDAGLVCDDGDACGTNDRCLVDGGCAATVAFVCPPPQGQCFDAGICTNSQDAGCTYAVRTAQSCADSSACTVNDHCRPDGGCAGDPMVCYQTQNPCKEDAGTCTAGVCSFTNIANNTACDDGQACTTGTTCNNGSCTAGSTTQCPATNICEDAGTCVSPQGCVNPQVSCVPNECQVGGACSVSAGGCQFSDKPDNTSCAAGSGRCLAGQCLTTQQPFDRYTPNNFLADGGQTNPPIIIDCAAAFDTGGAAPATFTGCNGQVFAETGGSIEVITQTSGNHPAALLRTAGLIIADGGSLTIRGSRPAIIAVYGDAVLGGVIDLSADGGADGPGAQLNCSAPAGGSPLNGSAVAGEGGSGAGGGGYAAKGGNGGDGDNYNTNGVGRDPHGVITLTPLIGGCNGGIGGTFAGPSAVAGAGGGALQISASRTLTLAGAVHANGGGGAGGKNGAVTGEGAGGGGSGGALRFEADVIKLRASAVITTNGGTGGEGGSSGIATGSGEHGLTGRRDYGVTTGPGDNAGGTAGGSGAGGVTLAGANAANAPAPKNGGGGGGGAVGRIYLRFTSAATSCRESGYLISPSSAAVTGGYSAGNAGFSGNLALPAAVASCP